MFRKKMMTSFLMVTAGALLLAGWAPEASARRSGWGVGAIFRDDFDFGMQARWNRLGGGRITLVPQLGYFFDDGAMDANFDGHLTLKKGSEEKPLNIYALGGVNWVTDFDFGEVGFNVGGGIDKDFSAGLGGFAEIKYVISDADGMALTAGIHF
ncbi:MAG TPA: hypothetical protein VF720_07300 [Candidatus Eisenbacteria bacterium]